MNIRRCLSKISNALTPPIILEMLHKFFYNQQILSASREMQKYSKLHLGCGSNIIDGWANIDLSGDARVIRWNCTTRLPITAETINLVYAEHFIEHINLKQAKDFLGECYRVLQPGGILRLSTPNLRKIVDEYLLGEASDWKNIRYSSNPVSQYTPCRMVNDAMRLWGHEFVYDPEELTSLLKSVGFREIIPVAWRESKHNELKGLECRPFYGEIIFEALK